MTIVKNIYILGWLNCSQLEMEGRKVDGNYRSRKKGKLLQSSQGGFDTPWNFFALMSLPDPEIYEWLRLRIC